MTTAQEEPEQAEESEEATEDAGTDSAGETAPPVVVVVVCHDPGPWFEETLVALRDQDYPNLVVVVLDAASAEDPTARVASVLPGAFVRRVEENRGFGATANEVLEVVEGASHFVFCHDDVAPEPGAVRLMVEEAFRSNAAIVAPKLVAWDDPGRILSVGMNADKLGALAERAIPGELDQEQHDSVRDIFVAPGGFTLVRADLFISVGGFDPLIRMFGEDLDLCWRAQTAGARVVVAPAARVRHIEVTRSGTQWCEGVTSQEDVRALTRRHELRTVLKCYGRFHLLRVLPQAVLASVAEAFICLAGGKSGRARAILDAWRWNLRSLATLRAERRKVQADRHLPDGEVREYQVAGFARVSSFTRRVAASYSDVHHLSLHGVETHDDAPAEDVFGHVEEVEGVVRNPRVLLSIAGRWNVEPPGIPSLVWIGVLILLFIGMRHWATAAFPILGQIARLPSSLNLVHRYIDEGRTAGLGAYSPAPSAFGLLGLVGTVLFGATGFLQKLLFLGSIPVGALGAYRIARPFGARLPRLVGMVAYLIVPLPYDLFAAGRLEALVAYAATPWLLLSMFRASGLEPFGTVPAEPFGTVLRLRPQRSWIASGVLMALVLAIVPGEIVVLAIVLIGVALGSLLVGGHECWRRPLVRAAGGVLIAAVLLFPWLPGFAGTWHGLVPLLGQGGPAWSAPGLGSFVRFDLGPLGGGIAGWFLLIPAGLAVLVGGGWRFRWAVRMWGVMVVSWLAAWAGAHGWMGATTLDPELLLVPGALALALAVALGACAFTLDLPSHRFGWRQLVPAAAAFGLFVAVLPVFASLSGGQFNLPATGWDAVLANAPGYGGLTLWIGDPRVLPMGSWPLAPGVAYAVSEQAVPDATDLWPPVDPHGSRAIAAAILRARDGLTTQLGSDLEKLGIGRVVVPLQLAPDAPGTSPAPAPAPWVVPTLASQGGLEQVQVDPSLDYFVDFGFAASHTISDALPGPHVSTPPAPPYRYGELLIQFLLWAWAVRVLVGSQAIAWWRRRMARRAAVRAASPVEELSS